MNWGKRFAGKAEESREEMMARLEETRVLEGEAAQLVCAARADLLRWLQEMGRRCAIEGAGVRMVEDVSDSDLIQTWGFLIGAVGTFRTAQGNVEMFRREVEDMIRTLADEEVWK